MSEQQMLMILGGNYHDFDGFAQAMVPVFQAAGWQVEPTYDLNVLLELDRRPVEVLTLYTCLGGSNQDGRIAEDLNRAQTDALIRWVEAGGGVLAMHATTVVGEENQALRRLWGGTFVSHPPPFAFTIYPMFREHPITQGIEAFTAVDEFYIQQYDASVEVHMVAMDRGVCYPMVWSRQEGAGHVAHIAPGHGPQVWSLPAYQRLMVQAARWVAGEVPEDRSLPAR